MKKENVCVLIDSEEMRLRALEILENAGEKVALMTRLNSFFRENMWLITNRNNEWYTAFERANRNQITIDELESLLLQSYVVKDVCLTVEELRQQAERLGLELVEKKREIKAGDFGVFWDEININVYVIDFLKEIVRGNYVCKQGVSWNNFRHITDEEKEKIAKNW